MVKLYTETQKLIIFIVDVITSQRDDKNKADEVLILHQHISYIIGILLNSVCDFGHMDNFQKYVKKTSVRT